MSVLLVGLSAAGKSTLCEALVQQLKMRTVNFGDLVIHCKDYAPCPQLCRTCPAELPRRRACMTEHLKDSLDTLILNAHAVFLNETGAVVYGFSPPELRRLKLTLLVLVEARPQVLLARRHQDALLRPDRPDLTVEELDALTRLQRGYVERLAAEAGIELLVYDNSLDWPENRAAFAALAESVRRHRKEGCFP